MHPNNTENKERFKKLNALIRNTVVTEKAILQFDPVFYQLFNDDLLNLSLPEIEKHYESSGKKDERYRSAAHLLAECKANPHDHPSDFDPVLYLNKNFDLLLDDKIEKNTSYVITHYLTNIKNGRKPSAVYSSKQDLSLNAPSHSTKKIAVLVHVFYPELLTELHHYINHLTLAHYDFDIYFNIVDSIYHSDIEDQIKRDFPNATIVTSPNYERDIGGFIQLMRHVDFSKYDIFFLAHTKKSIHTDPAFATRWRQNLLNAILRNPEKVTENVTLMRANPSIGMIGSGVHHSTGIEMNSSNYFSLLDQFNIQGEARTCLFLAGTMMMIRPDILKPLIEHIDPLKLANCDLLDKNNQLDGLVAHAVERVIGNLVRHFGYTLFWQTED